MRDWDHRIPINRGRNHSIQAGQITTSHYDSLRMQLRRTDIVHLQGPHQITLLVGIAADDGKILECLIKSAGITPEQVNYVLGKREGEGYATHETRLEVATVCHRDGPNFQASIVQARHPSRHDSCNTRRASPMCIGRTSRSLWRSLPR
jgi:hypothetical protein